MKAIGGGLDLGNIKPLGEMHWTKTFIVIHILSSLDEQTT